MVVCVRLRTILFVMHFPYDFCPSLQFEFRQSENRRTRRCGRTTGALSRRLRTRLSSRSVCARGRRAGPRHAHAIAYRPDLPPQRLPPPAPGPAACAPTSSHIHMRSCPHPSPADKAQGVNQGHSRHNGNVDNAQGSVIASLYRNSHPPISGRVPIRRMSLDPHVDARLAPPSRPSDELDREAHRIR